MNHINRYGETEVHPAKGKVIVDLAPEDEYGMHREEELSPDVDWSHDPRSESAHEKHVVPDRQVVQDDELRAQVIQVLGDFGQKIEVHVDAGIVTLRGAVEDRKDKIWAESVIDDLKMARDIFNQLSVTSAPDGLRV